MNLQVKIEYDMMDKKGQIQQLILVNTILEMKSSRRGFFTAPKTGYDDLEV